MTAVAANSWRQEIFCKTTERLKGQLPFIEGTGVRNFNLPNKAKGELPCLLERARLLSSALPQSDVCVHFSINANYQRTPEATFASLTAFCCQLASVARCSLLLVSGGGPRRRLDSVEVLERMAASPEWSQLRLPLAVAYNPYFPDERRQQEERARLHRKFVAGRGRVQAVYIQAGSNVQQLRDGLQHLQQLLGELGLRQQIPTQQGIHGGAESSSRSAASIRKTQIVQQPPAREREPKRQRCDPADGAQGEGTDIQVFGSVFLPSKKLLAAMRFRPWGGVFLSEDYLGSVEGAESITRRVLATYAEWGVTPLVESEVVTQLELDRMQQLLPGPAQP